MCIGKYTLLSEQMCKGKHTVCYIPKVAVIHTPYTHTQPKNKTVTEEFPHATGAILELDKR